ncbi:MAG TPA: S8 family serine peptidase [Blastocatellia bacterium]|nr:S8 family serine peptidase [Blastocatellia bacterium]
MNSSKAQKITLLLASLAAVIVFCPSLLKSGAASSDTAKQLRMAMAANEKLILLRRAVLDTETRIDRDTSNADRSTRIQRSSVHSSTAKRTRLVQFAGPIKRVWMDALLATGARIVGYIPNNAYIIRGAPDELARVAELDGGPASDDARPIRWMGRLLPVEKLDTTFTDEILDREDGLAFDVEIELMRTIDSASVDAITRSAVRVNHERRRFGEFVVLSVTLRQEQLLEIAGLEDVLFIGPASKLMLHDELSAQITAGNLVADSTRPNGPGYLDWLAGKGLSTVPDFVVDISDSGLDRGSASPAKLHPDFLDAGDQSRVAYLFNYANDGKVEDKTGHGTIVASAAVGKGASNRMDALGYLYGLGVDPTVRLGASRIFDSDGAVARPLSYTTVASTAYSAGARVSNNSWGNIANTYDSVAQEFDSLVRDAQPSVPGNQEMVFVFSAGNGGPGGRVGSPGIAKNVISVAASENYRPAGLDSCDVDGGGGIGPDGADNPLDILRYSSGGPTADLRAKPDISAPGTHVFGAASQVSGFFGVGLCAGAGLYRPPDQSLYTWSSGTSLAAPHVTGAASLLRKFFTSRNLLEGDRAPSPAMTKAYLLNSASYMTGENAGGDLPGARQGWGLVDLSRAFDGVARVLVDQTKVFSETGQTFEIQGSLVDRSLPLRATLAWTDAMGSLVGPALVNDLDLEITVGGVSVYRGNNFAGPVSLEGGAFDRLNNVESIYLPPDVIPAGVQGNFTITVRAANIAGDGIPGNDTILDQDFALVVYNFAPTVVVDPPPPHLPVITGATYVKKRLTISGHDFTGNAQVEINGKIIHQEFEFDSVTNSLSLKLKPRKLNLSSEADNQVVLIEKGFRSPPFVLRY